MIRNLPLTPGGLLFVGGGAFLLFRGLSRLNPYEIVLGGGALLVSALLAVLGFRTARGLASFTPVWTPPSPMAAGGEEPQHFQGPEPGLPWFFRLHLGVWGSLKLGEGRRIILKEELALDNGGRGALVLRFPLAGVFQGAGRLLVRDVFGLFSFPAGREIRRTLPVMPAPLWDSPPIRVEASSGAEDNRRRRSSDEERYHMREYVPGDRYRDINWKTSSRLALLVTRISPFAQEKTQIIPVEFRSGGPTRRPSLAALWTLDRTKARLLAFLRLLQEENENFVFRLKSAAGERDITSAEDLDDFARELSGLSFSSPWDDSPALVTPQSLSGSLGSELFLFSTSYDTGLPRYLASRGENLTRLFLTLSPRTGLPAGPEGEILHIRDLFHPGLPWDQSISGGGDFLRSILRCIIPYRASSFKGAASSESREVLSSVPRPFQGGTDTFPTEIRL